MLKLKIGMLAITLLILSLYLYAISISLAEGRFYAKLSLDNLLLTPKNLAKISVFCKTSPVFYFSAADGPKPSITSFMCELDEIKALKYLVDSGFYHEVSRGDKSKEVYKNKDVEIEFFKNEEQDIDKVIMLEYL